MVMGIATPEIIREAALDCLSDYPEGIRQADLISMTDGFLSQRYIYQGHAVKNAVWNLDEKYPDFVIKKKITHRNVLFLPTDKLLKVNKKERTDHVSTFKYDNKDLVEVENRMRINLLTAQISVLLRQVEMSDIDSTSFTVQNTNFAGLNGQEIEAVINIKSALEQLKKYRNVLTHTKKD